MGTDAGEQVGGGDGAFSGAVDVAADCAVVVSEVEVGGGADAGGGVCWVGCGVYYSAVWVAAIA